MDRRKEGELREERRVASILVVDDEASSRRILRLGFENAGYEVETAADGQEALGKLREGRFDVLITDVNMPRMDGQELCSAILQEPPDPAPLIFVLTARTGANHRDWTGEVDGVELVEKPASLRQLVGRVGERLAIHDAAVQEPK